MFLRDRVMELLSCSQLHDHYIILYRKGEYHLKTLKNNMLIDLVCLKNDAENNQLHQR